MNHWRDDIDYPVSWMFWRDHCRMHGYDPGPDEPINEQHAVLQEVSNPWTNRQWDYVQQLKSQILFLERKLNEHIDKSRKRRAPY